MFAVTAMAAADTVAQQYLQTNKGAHIHKTASLVEPSGVSVGGKVCQALVWPDNLKQMKGLQCIVSDDATLDATGAPVTLGRRVFVGKGSKIIGSPEPK